ncbi:MAG TPA: hypothetical protein VIB48_04390 [Acidimicrobiia bacterium]
MHVDRIGRQVEDIAPAPHHHELGGAECGSELRRQRLQPVAHPRRRVLAPQRVDDLFGRHHPAGIDREQGEQRLLLAGRDRNVPIPRIPDLEAAEEPDPHAHDGTRRRRRPVSDE